MMRRRGCVQLYLSPYILVFVSEVDLGHCLLVSPSLEVKFLSSFFRLFVIPSQCYALVCVKAFASVRKTYVDEYPQPYIEKEELGCSGVLLRCNVFQGKACKRAQGCLELALQERPRNSHSLQS